MTANRLINLCAGTVAEWTIAAALKAAGRKARGFESLPFREGIRRASRMSGIVALTWTNVRGRPLTVALVCGALLSRLLSFETTVRPDSF